MKERIIIRMGASKFDALVRVGDELKLYDLRAMQPRDQHNFRRTLVKAFEEAQCA